MVVTACPLDCPDTCSLEVTVDAGRITRVDAAPGNPITDGWICAKVRRHAERVHGPARLHTPLVRSGPKGSGQFRPVSWDEALDLVADAVRRATATDGPASVIPYSYNSSGGVLANVLPDRLWAHVGASRVAHTICAATASQAWADTFGSMLGADPRDVVHSRYVVVWGANPSASNTHWPPLVTQAVREQGAEVVVVDPRATPMAARADVHLALRPGTDVVLALAVARHLEHEDLLDRDFLSRHVDGVDRYLDNARPWTLERAADVCGLEADAIASFAERYATTRPALLRIGWGLERNRNGGSACRSVLALPLLCGHFGTVGSGIVTSTTRAAPIDLAALEADLPVPTAERRVVNMNQLGALLCGELPGPPARVLVVQGANPAVMNPAQVDVLRGLAREDLFTVVHDQVLTDTAALADVVLPATTHFEADDVATSYGSYTLGRMTPVIPPVGESRTNAEVAAALAARLGLPAEWFDADPARTIAALVGDGHAEDAPGVHELRAPGETVGFVDVFPTFRDRRARLHVPGGELPLPRYAALDDDAHPLTLLTPASARLVNSMFGEFNAPPAVLSMSPADAAARGLEDGARVRVFNERAALELPLRIDATLRDGICVIPKGLWRRDGSDGLTANALCPDRLSDLAAGACFNDARVDVRRGA